MINTVEFFCGTKSFSKVARELGYSTFTTDSNKTFKPDYCINILDFDIKRLPYRPDVAWFSPECKYFSVASMWKHWNKDYTPKTLYAECAIGIIKRMIYLIDQIKPTLIYIENPRGMLRHTRLLDHYIRHTVTYCQYGETRMKPTDIWTNDKLWIPRKACETTDSCHTTRTEDLNTSAQKAVVPKELCYEILKSAEYNLQSSGLRKEFYMPGPAQLSE
jgi:hypothetical protein